jgi:NADPH2:quinone reductase
MRRVVCHAFGPLQDLKIEDGPSPEPREGQVVVDVKAAGVNFVDALFVQGKYQIKPPTPFTPGGELAGVTSDGRRVIASSGLGAFAEQVALAEASLYDLPDELSFGVGATVVQSYATAVFSLKMRTVVQPGEWVLVLGAGGGVGRAAVDVATSVGARVIAVASSEEKRQLAKDAGAEETIDAADDIKTKAREISGGGVDVVYDPVGGALAEPALRALRFDGRFLVVGFAAGEIPRLPANQILLNNRTVIGVEWGGWVMRHPDENRVLVNEILEACAAGTYHPIEPAPYPLEDVAKVLHDFENRKVAGKVVLVP